MKYSALTEFIKNNQDISFASFIRQNIDTVKSFYINDGIIYRKNLTQAYLLEIKKQHASLTNAETKRLSEVEEQVWQEIEAGTSSSSHNIESLTTASSSNTGLKRKASKANLTMKDVFVADEEINCDWVVDGKSIPKTFKAYQKDALEFCKAKDGKLTMKQHLDELLSLSGVLLLEKNKIISPLMNKHLNKDVLNKAYGNKIDNLPFVEFPMSLEKEIKKCLIDLQSHNDKEVVDDDLGGVRAKTQDPVTRKVISALKWCLPFVPFFREPVITENHLSHSYVSPLLTTLFMQNNTNPHSSNGVMHADVQTDKTRPDFKADVYEDGNIIYSNIFGEYKAAAARGTEEAALDLYRLSLFAKNVIDKKRLQSVLTAQTIGEKIDFYLNTRSCDHVMITVFLCSVSLPGTIDQIVALTAYLDSLASVYKIYITECFKPLDAGIKKCSSLPFDVLLKSLNKPSKKNKTL